MLQQRQQDLSQSKNNFLREYISVKNQRNELKSELDKLKSILMDTRAELGLDPLKEKWRKNYLSRGLRRDPLLEHMLCLIFNASSNSEILDRELYYEGLTCMPIMHSNGGIADLEFIRGKESITGSELEDQRMATYFLEKWCDLKGFTPAYQIRTEERRTQQQIQKTEQQLTIKKNNGPKLRR